MRQHVAQEQPLRAQSEADLTATVPWQVGHLEAQRGGLPPLDEPFCPEVEAFEGMGVGAHPRWSPQTMGALRRCAHISAVVRCRTR